MVPFKSSYSQLLWATAPSFIWDGVQSEEPTVYKPEYLLWNTILADVLGSSVNRTLVSVGERPGSVWLQHECRCSTQMAIYYVTLSARKLAPSVAWWPKSVSSSQGHLFFSPTDFCRHGNHPTSGVEMKANSLLPAPCQRGNIYINETE